MKECSKAILRRLHSSGYATRYFRGRGVDIGGAPDPLALYKSLFPLIEDVKTWDREDGDAQFMQDVPDNHFDFVHSSHCLEHLDDCFEGLRNWFRILKPGGYLIVTVPDEDLYEQGVFPSTFNRDHRRTFTIFKPNSWSKTSVNVVELLQELGPESHVIKIELIDSAYRYELPRFDQTLSPVSESAIEFIVRKRRPEEVAAAGRLPSQQQPPPSLRLHFNQYRDDQKTLRTANPAKPPFLNEAEL
ncbi:MAG TPA: class I SAM-dependent methyltransferase [Bryobacteraceae bacterium]|nr:class I SAM-dependent methyltransferase [Bryobacteraceae bacterium]